MSEEKISSDEVPGKFTEWLLAMGCPAGKVASVENIASMCRGQYYMVWRSLMEQVEAKDVIQHKRLQVFCNDIRRSQKKNIICESDVKTWPEQLLLWKQQMELHKKVEDAKARVMLAQQDLDQLTDKISSKMYQRDISRRRVSATTRRAGLLRGVAAELLAKTDNLRETRSIADSLCAPKNDEDIQNKVDKCINSLRRQSAPAAPTSLSSSTANAVSANGDQDFEELVCSVARCRGDELCARLGGRRARLVRHLTAHAPRTDTHAHTLTPQSVLAHTAALHCTLALEATKNTVHLQQTRKRLVTRVTELNNYLTGEACELLVVRCEKVNVEARLMTLRTLLDELTARSGVFQVVQGEEKNVAGRSITAADKAIEIKKEELKRVICSLASTDRKIQSVRECLAAVFNAFQKDGPQLTNSQYRGLQVDLPAESIPALLQYYAARREARQEQVDLSLELEVSEGSITDAMDCNNPRFIDELKIYLKKFNLEKNRQLILESGEKIWIFETVKSSVERLHAQWLAADTASARLWPDNVQRILLNVHTRAELEAVLDSLYVGEKVNVIDISIHMKEEEELTDRTKKRLRESLLDLQKANKTFALGKEDLALWTENSIRKFILQTRMVDGLKYKDYENYYIENCLNV